MKRLAIILLLAVSLSACGGGGGSSSKKNAGNPGSGQSEQPSVWGSMKWDEAIWN